MLLKNYIKLQILYNSVVGKYYFFVFDYTKKLQLSKATTERTIANAIIGSTNKEERNM